MAKRNGGIIGKVNTPTSSTAVGVWRLQDQFNARKNDIWPGQPISIDFLIIAGGGGGGRLGGGGGPPKNQLIYIISKHNFILKYGHITQKFLIRFYNHILILTFQQCDNNIRKFNRFVIKSYYLTRYNI